MINMQKTWVNLIQFLIFRLTKLKLNKYKIAHAQYVANKKFNMFGILNNIENFQINKIK